MGDTAACIVGGTLASVLRASRVLGLAPLRLLPLRNATLPLRGLVELLLSAWTIRKSSFMAIVLIVINALTPTSAVVIAVFDGINRMKRLIFYLDNLKEIHEELENDYLSLRIKYTGMIFWGFLLFIIMRQGWAIYNIVQEAAQFGFKSNTLMNYALSFSKDGRQILLNLVMMQFAFTVCSVNATLRVLNDRFRSLIYKLKLYDSMKNRSVSNAHITTRRLCRAYMSICQLVRSIDHGEGAFVFILLVASILDMMYSLYLIISFIKTMDHLSLYVVFKLGVLVILGLYKAASLILLVEPCHQTRQEFQEVQSLVSELMCASHERKFRDELSRYHDQFVFNTPAFSPLGICVLTRQFIVMVMSSTTTFITIILQFGLKENIKL